MLKFFVLIIVLVGSVSITGCATVQKAERSVTFSSEEEAVVKRVYQRIAADPATSALRLGVTMDDGIVTLSGRIDDAAVRLRAISVVRGTPGVRGVIDQTIQF